MNRRSAGGIWTRVAADRERALAEWRTWADNKAAQLLRMDEHDRIRELRYHHDDLTETAWYRVTQSLLADERTSTYVNGSAHTGAQRRQPEPPGDDPSAPAEIRVPAGTVAAHAHRSSAVRADRPSARRAALKPAPPRAPNPQPVENQGTSRGSLTGHLYDILVGIITIAGVAGGLVWLLSGQIN